ncbi:uncharacterized protein LOC124794720 [Schistocerca piceifrons]|uniref:uncharacterized protein LOC124794720 n=1 Tax=Schistocerca piceifrons TaxID=274613 RepID=UPI001F5FE3AF|nr:uncharacterized protein LOC124794720 [Schistocerca piceifrons]
MNGNFLPHSAGKRKKRHDHKQCVYLEEWLEKSSQQVHTARPHYGGRDDASPSGYWPPPPSSRRLFAALSDPAVCRYSAVPMGYSLEPVLCQVYQPPPPYHPIQVQHCSYPARCQRERPRKQNIASQAKMPATASPADPGQEFASLPPAAQSMNVPEATQRRFSDPGLGPAVASSEDESGSEDAGAYAVIGPSVPEQIASLHNMMKTMSRELQELRTELETLKLQTATWRNVSRSYEPGMLSELVREVRDAARMREDALMARVCNMLSASDKLKWSNSTPQLSDPVNGPSAPSSMSACLGISQGSREIEELKAQLKEALVDKKHTEERLLKVEAQLQNLRLKDNVCDETQVVLEGNTGMGDSGRDRVLRQELQQLKCDKFKLTCELEEALATRKTAEENAEKMERLVDVLRKKINGVVQEEKQQQILQEVTLMEQSPSSLENTSESLVSVGSSSTGRSSSLQSPQVTMSGPVTDL